MIETVRAPRAVERPSTTGAADAAPVAPDPPRQVGSRRSTLLMAVAAMALLVVLGALHSTNGFLNDDVAPKGATLAHLERTGSAVLPYWASSIDPTAVLHPLHWGLTPVDGGWVAVSTAPDLAVLRVLDRLGGRHAQLLLPAFGAVLAALAVRSITQSLLRVRQTGDAADGHDGDPDDGLDALRRRAGALAFWGALCGTPLLVYGLEIWEHSLGLAGGLWSVALLVRLAGRVDDDERGRRPHPLVRPWLLSGLAAGTVLGLGAALRNEVLLQGVTIAAVVFAWLADAQRRRGGWRRVGTAVVAGIGFAVGLAVVLAANRWCEQAMLGTATHAAKASVVARGDGSGAGRRAATAAVQLLGWWRSDALVPGLVFVVALATVVRARRGVVAVLGGAVAGALLVQRFAAVGTNVPGILTTSPLAIVGTGRLGRRFPQRRVAGVIVLGTILAVLATASLARRDGYLSLWSARYYLEPALVLAAVGAAGLAQLDQRRRIVAIASWIGMSLLGVSFLAASTQLYDGLTAQVTSADVPVVSREPYLLRNLAMASAERAAFTAPTDADAATAVRLLLDHGATCIVVLAADPAAPRTPAGLTATPGLPNGSAPIGGVRAWTLRTGAPCVSEAAVRADVEAAAGTLRR